jgi:DNA adenine methylase
MHHMQFKPIIPWMGGKRRLSKYILPIIPEHTCYVEPFAGAAAILFLKAPSKVEVINDINLDLITLYRVVQNHLEEFIRQYKWSLTSRKMFEWLQDTPPDMKKVFTGFKMNTVDIDYTVGGGGKGKGRKELIIQNW